MTLRPFEPPPGPEKPRRRSQRQNFEPQTGRPFAVFFFSTVSPSIPYHILGNIWKRRREITVYVRLEAQTGELG